MTLIIKKFGGTSLGCTERINKVANLISSNLSFSNKLIVVVSAMAGFTDQLVSYASSVHNNAHNFLEYDQVLASGEQINAGLMSLALNSLGIKAISLLGWQVPIYTNSAVGDANITGINVQHIKQVLAEYQVIVIPGFQGIDAVGKVTTLGRGGSDTTAVALAAALKSELCEIYTDVTGVFSADPRIVKQARLLPKISYEEMLEFAASGAKVLQMRAARLAMQYNVKLKILSSFEQDVGTAIIPHSESFMEQDHVTGITHRSQLLQVKLCEVPSRLDVVGELFSAADKSNLTLSMVNYHQNDNEISFIVKQQEREQLQKLLAELKYQINFARVEYTDDLSEVSVIGFGVGRNSSIMHKLISCLAESNIQVHRIAASEIKVSLVIPEIFTELAVRTLHHTLVPTENVITTGDTNNG